MTEQRRKFEAMMWRRFPAMWRKALACPGSTEECNCLLAWQIWQAAQQPENQSNDFTQKVLRSELQ